MKHAASLNDEDRRFRTLAQNVPDLVFTASIDGDVLYCNSRWYAYTGTSAADALGSSYLASVHPDDREALVATWSAARAGGREATAQARYCRHDGVYRLHQVTIAPDVDQTGRVFRCLGILSDVHAERSAERSFRTLAEAVPTMVWAARADGFVDYYNIRWQERVAPIDALLGDGWSAIVHPDDLAATLDAWNASVACGDDYFTRLRLRMRNGECRWHESTATAERDETGAILRWYGACVDVHESVLLREELRDQDVVTRLLRELARRTPTLLFSITADGRIDFLNERWSQLIGTDADAMLGLGWMKFIHADDLPNVTAALARHLHSGDPYVGQCRLKRSDEAYRWIEIRAEAQRDEAGAIDRWYGAGIDIDTQRRAIDALELLAHSGASAATADDVDTTLARVAGTSLAGVADISIFDILESDGQRRRVVVGAAGVPEAAIELIRSYATPAHDVAHPIAKAIAQRTSIHVAVVDEAFFESYQMLRERRAAWSATGIRSMIVAPLARGDKVLGALTLLRTSTSVPFDDQDVRVVEEIARRVAVAVENIRLRELARAESVERDERFHIIADAIPQLMWVADTHGAVEWVNQRWLDFTGQTFVQALDAAWDAIVHPDDEARARARWIAAGELGTNYECDFRLRGHDGIYRWFLGRATSMMTSTGRKWYGTNTDIDDARRAELTLQVFADVGEALSESLGLQATLDAVMQIVVPDYADWAFVTLCDESDDLYVAAIYHTEARKSELLATQVGKMYARANREVGSPAAIRAREPLLYQHATYEDAARVVERDVLDVFWRVVGYDSVLVVPLIAGLTVRGTLTVCMSQSRRAFEPRDVPFFAELGRRIAPAIANAELYERERRVAQSFQQAALPSSLPQADGYIFSAIYEAGRAEALVGGDWYDAFKVLDGRIVVSIGDVAGSGLRAAVTMANIRQAIRGVAHVHADPELMLEAADRALRSENPDAFATAFVGVIDPIAHTITYKSAGHPPALVGMPDRRVEELRTGGLPLGLRGSDREPATVAQLVPGAVLYLYTDGLTESTRDMLAGERRLREAIALTADIEPTERATAIYRNILVDGSRDDVAIMSVTVVSRLAPLRWTLDALDNVSAARVRAEILTALELDRTPDLHQAAELILAEVVGNLARYVSAGADVVLEWDGGRPVMHVRDRGPGFEFLPKLPPDVYSESGRGLFLISALAVDFNVTRRPEGGSHTRVVFAT